MAGSTSKRYPPELRERASRMVAEIAGDHESQWAAMNEVARLLGIGTAETVRKWVRQGEVDAGQRPGATSDESAELKRLRRENAELKRANGILKGASFFAAELDRPHLRSWSSYAPTRAAAKRRAWYGRRPICAVLTEHGLPIAPSTCSPLPTGPNRAPGTSAT